MRLAGLVAGTVYLEALVPADLRREFLGISTITIIVTTATLLVVRWLGVRFTRQDNPGQSARQEGLPFSIRGLMIFTAVVALICAVAKAMEGSRNPIVFIPVWALCFVAVGLISLWAMLGNSNPLHRGPVVFVLSPMLGAFFAFAAGAQQAGWIYILLIMLLYPVGLLGSLLVVRSCGYRLVRRVVPSEAG
jgi:CDP-diglyceride synthetase